ncbi:Asp-tRNAAsn/Glu-tRNAGln amidotransferase A subunit and related amidase [Rubrobacter radiotolerans]|uniref:Amidase family protein n=1 Tax=Rubrobacter radiotolerans TaxID=42256 RepID=A0A023X4H6_RUBRA|nr:amidase family protein [Rubrobacter radiotolerans]AHY46959.1 Asp-tRNAAsn/Glu-tRNAGln amidotransferase A subunit and related amidase [Rubrobacter radiotolerans]MDX5894365.1 amidase family protein [Rubrobacter radiotolerans]SMC05835.1 amidase [Rubrobacter radiotolerans DSM 5868]
MTEELWRWSATELARAIRTRRVSSRETVESCLGRIEEVNGHLNALVELSAEESLEAADAADRAVSEGREVGPLHGVPVSIKINSDQAGHATTNGVVAFKDNVAEVDSPHVAKLREAGAVFLGRSNTPAFSYRWFADNDLHGRTLNPWDEGRTPGGSSGGASSSVASGMVPIGHGNDIGGSVRYPAYACGVVGIRPTVGRVPSWYGPPAADEALSVQSMLVQGPLARSVADLRLALDAMSGFDARDPFSAPLPPASANEPLSRPVRVGLVRDVGVASPESAVNEALDAAAGWLVEAGYIVEEVELPLLEEAYRLWYLLCMEEFRQIMPLVEEIGDTGMKLAAKTYYTAAEGWWGANPSLDDYMNGYARRGTLIGRLQAFMQNYPLVLLPVSAEQAFEHDADISSIERGLEVVAAQWSMMAIPMLGFPAMSVPTGISNGLPAGVQLLGRRFREDTLFEAAEVIEARCGTLTPVSSASSEVGASR